VFTLQKIKMSILYNIYINLVKRKKFYWK